MPRRPPDLPSHGGRRRWIVWLAVGLIALAGLGLAARHALFLFVEHEAFTTPTAGRLTPDQLGVPSQQITFASGDRMLRGSFVAAHRSEAAALLILHGDDEDIARWAAVQARLHAAGLSSFVFDYSGYGDSTGRPSIARLEEDALVAYERLVALTPGASAHHLLGFSLGSAVMLDVAGDLHPRPAGLVIAAGFTSAREMAVATGLVAPGMAWLLPDLWNNERRLADVALPLLIVHGRDDEVVPLDQARRLCEAARGPRRLVVIDDLLHDAPLDPAASGAFWDVIAGRMTTGPLVDAAEGRSPCRTAR